MLELFFSKILLIDNTLVKPLIYLQAKKLDNQKQCPVSSIQIELNEENQLQVVALNTILLLMHCIELNWTRKQRSAIE